MRGLARGNKQIGNPDADLPGGDAPVDVAAVRRDDALIDAIAGGGPVATDSPEQYELALLLANWRADIVATPMPDGPLLDDVIAAMDTANARDARSAARGKLRLLRPIAGAAAAIAVVMGGATIFSYNAEPGDPLWSVKSVVFSQQADSTVAQIDTTSQLEQAERMLAAGDAESAKNMLEHAADRAGGIRDADQRRQLEVWRAKLAAQLAEIAPTTTAQAPAPGTTTTDAPIQASQLPTSVPGTPGTTLPGVEPSPGGNLPTTDLQLPGLPAIPLPQLPQQPQPATPLPSTVDPTIMLVPTLPSDLPSTEPPTQQQQQSTAPLPTTTISPVPPPPTS
ncbi:anti-sigma-D factor RsdA [Rhodococcus tibetensis]|uniref:Anti-sigma-D factor RsdA n=1 Tax=Rhodococcus tibetensis TaxID=2965064 RepID=A0ABT1QDD2_9NOCA|nr:anti-sigma-D factor RsdA [Rhodococcus sp. FXJ9.536]MCQ4120256.1 anti-sigma-D factor RsdA [Rhodococcus sp. FXJ9.536]